MIGRTNTGGGGGLNFKVVGGTTAPSNPKENMIWVNTSTKITSYIFSATQPTAASGRVWFSTSTSSPVEFNALKKNVIQVYPISAKQYVNGEWLDVNGMIRQEGEWKYLVVPAIILMQNGSVTDEYGSFGNPNRYTYSSTHHGRRTFTLATDNEKATLKWTHYSGSEAFDSSYAYFENKIDLTDVKNIKLNIGELALGGLQDYNLCVITKIGDNINNYEIASKTLEENKENTLDVSAVSGSYYLCIKMYSKNTEATSVEIKDWRLEK